MPANNKSKDYTKMARELDSIIDWFEGDDVNLEEAIGKYEKAMKLIRQMEEYLNTAENKIKKIDLNFGG